MPWLLIVEYQSQYWGSLVKLSSAAHLSSHIQWRGLVEIEILGAPSGTFRNLDLKADRFYERQRSHGMYFVCYISFGNWLVDFWSMLVKFRVKKSPWQSESWKSLVWLLLLKQIHPLQFSGPDAHMGVMSSYKFDSMLWLSVHCPVSQLQCSSTQGIRIPFKALCLVDNEVATVLCHTLLILCQAANCGEVAQLSQH